MKIAIARYALLVSTGVCISMSGSAGQPPDPVSSDSLQNTAMGTGVLQNNKGNGNTGAGDFALGQNTTGDSNTAMGISALTGNLTGNSNSAFGAGALLFNQAGSSNTAAGTFALQNNLASNNTAFGTSSLLSNTSGYANTAVGVAALSSNLSGFQNTAVGGNALAANTNDYDTAVGFDALQSNTNGYSNTGIGVSALTTNSSGFSNTGIGVNALYTNSIGNLNTAAGQDALFSNVQGNNNTAAGFKSLNSNTTGNSNAALGYEALFSNVSGQDNVAVGASAGSNIVGSNNIDIGHTGAAGDNGKIRIGTPKTQTTVFIAGIENTKVTGSAVYVTAAGQLGVLASSERYKTAITSMGTQTQLLAQLRPVTFHLKTEPKGALQYGLIAEEVARIYPDLVIRDEQGTIQGVRYDELAPMLLKEVQQQERRLAADDAALRGLDQQVAELKQLNVSMVSAISRLENHDRQVAMR